MSESFENLIFWQNICSKIQWKIVGRDFGKIMGSLKLAGFRWCYTVTIACFRRLG